MDLNNLYMDTTENVLTPVLCISGPKLLFDFVLYIFSEISEKGFKLFLEIFMKSQISLKYGERWSPFTLLIGIRILL